MNIYTIGFTQKNAKTFFETIKKNNINLLIDIRLNNKSQLAGFSKGEDLQYFLPTICNCEYLYCPEFAPDTETLDLYKGKKISWNEYEVRYTKLINERNVVKQFFSRFNKYNNMVLLCSEPTAEQCHRRLLANMIKSELKEVKIINL